MMTEWLMRTEMALKGSEDLKNKTVAIIGLGGVGGYVCEAVARSGVGTIIAVDRDTVSVWMPGTDPQHWSGDPANLLCKIPSIPA